MCDKAVNTYLSAIQYGHDGFETQKMCDEAINNFPFVFDSIFDWYLAQ